MKLIMSEQEYKEALAREYDLGHEKGYDEGYQDAKDDVEGKIEDCSKCQSPNKPNVATWLHKKKDFIWWYECSNCGKSLLISPPSNYCSSCGCKMIFEEEKTEEGDNDYFD